MPEAKGSDSIYASTDTPSKYSIEAQPQKLGIDFKSRETIIRTSKSAQIMHEDQEIKISRGTLGLLTDERAPKYRSKEQGSATFSKEDFVPIEYKRETLTQKIKRSRLMDAVRKASEN